MAGAMDRIGHTAIGRGAFRWLSKVRGRTRPFAYWFQKYTIDGSPEWETPAVDQTAVIPWGLEQHYRRTGDLDFVAGLWSMIEQAAAVCMGESGHPGLRWIEELSLVSSAGLWDHRYGAFLYSNASIVAGLRSAARLAGLLSKPESAAPWIERADRIWETGILGQPDAVGGPGLVDPSTGRFLDSRRFSTLRGLWTDRPELLVDQTRSLDISLLGLVVPFGLLPASDPRVVRTAEAILRHNVINGDASILTRWAVDPAQTGGTLTGRSLAPSDAHSHDVSSLATLWMARYLIQLGRETGQGRHWSRALAMLDGILGRLFPLGLMLRQSLRAHDAPRFTAGAASGVWGLHAMLVETLLDFAGIDFDALDRRLSLRPALPGSWPHIGLAQTFECGDVSYRLERPIGGTVHRLTLKSRLNRPVTLSAAVTCPGLADLEPWQSIPPLPPPAFEHRTGRLAWSVELPSGESSFSWTWG